MNGSSQWKLIDVLKEASAFLETQGIDSPRLNAERMLAHVLGLSRIELYVQFEKPLESVEREAYKTLLRRRARREPLQYLTGETEFMSLPFRVTPAALIPRPETEILVEQAIETAKDIQKRGRGLRILDIGTGSGCIAVSLAKMLPEARIDAVDRSEEALTVAGANAEQNGTGDQVTFSRVDIMEAPVPEGMTGYDLIVSNPPYIPDSVIDGLEPEVRDHEPREALSGGDDGLRFYRHFREILPQMLGTHGAVLLEIGADQGDAVKGMFQDGNWSSVRILQDLAGLDRVTELKR